MGFGDPTAIPATGSNSSLCQDGGIDPLDVRDARTVTRDAEIGAPPGRCGNGHRITVRGTGSFVDSDAPQIHRSGAIARKVQIAAVWRPDGIPVETPARNRKQRRWLTRDQLKFYAT